jgi:magnesium chelatase family protein
MDAPAVSVEVHLANGLPGMAIVGLPDAEVREAKDRVRAALQNSGFEMPARRITINLAPADLPKESGRFDLPIALGILAASGTDSGRRELDRYEFAGELSLSGELRPVRGALAMTFAMGAVRTATGAPSSCRGQCRRGGAGERRRHLSSRHPAAGVRPLRRPDDDARGCATATATSGPGAAPLSRLLGREGPAARKRALEIAAAGQHSVLLMGPPGAGKSMLASRFPGLLPPLTDEEALEAAAVQSLNGSFSAERWRRGRFAARITPVRAWPWWAAAACRGRARSRWRIAACCSWTSFPNSTARCSRCCASRSNPAASRSRARRSQADFPARFQLIAAMNPCPCGWQGHPSGKCHCTNEAVLRYQDRISGPLLDRIDMQIEVSAMAPDAMSAQPTASPAPTSPSAWRAPTRSSWRARASRTSACRRTRSTAIARSTTPTGHCAGHGACTGRPGPTTAC